MGTKRNIVSVIAIILMLLTLIPGQLLASDNSRIFGSGRIETALEICRVGWSSSDIAILAPADHANLVDALAAAALAGQEGAPILLTYKNHLDPAVKNRIISLGAKKVFIVGAISDMIVNELNDMADIRIEVLRGDNRWETAKAINEKLANPAGTFVVGYNALPDALSVASYAAAHRYAIVLADVNGRIPSGQSLMGTDIYIIGGQSLVKDIPGATRIYGTDRFETNMKIADTLDYSFTKVYVANGLNNHLVDSLTAAPLAARYGAFIALSDGHNVRAAGVVNQKLSSISEVIALGGPGLVSEQAKEKLRYGIADFRVESVRALDSTHLEVKFNRPIDKNSILVEPGYHTLKSGVIKIERNPKHDGEKDIDADYMYANLSPDGATLSLRVHQSTYMDGNYKVTISPGVIVTRDYGEELDGFSTTINVRDITPPMVRSVSYNPATDRIEVEMSEVCDVLPTIVVNNGGNEFLSEDNSKTILSFSNRWDREEEISIKVSGAVDYAGNKQVEPYNIVMRIPLDASPLNVTSVSQSDSNEFIIVFNKAIEPNDDNLRSRLVEKAILVTRNWVPISVTGVELDRDDTYKRTYRVILDSAGAPEYEFYAGNPSVNLTVFFDEGTLRDVYGYNNSEILKNVLMTKDNSGPKIISTRLTWSRDAFVLRFDEDIPGLHLGDVLQISRNGIDMTDQYRIVPIRVNEPNPREIKITYGAGGTPIEAGTYTITLAKDSIPDKHWNLNSVQSVEITVR